MSRNPRKKRRIITDETIDYKNVDFLSQFISNRGKILGRRGGGITAKRHRAITKAIKRARALGLISFTSSKTV